MINPRYARYAMAHGRTPDEMLAADVIDWPGGSMCGFMLWMNEQWATFCRLHDVLNSTELRLKLGSEEADAQFDTWQVEQLRPYGIVPIEEAQRLAAEIGVVNPTDDDLDLSEHFRVPEHSQ